MKKDKGIAQNIQSIYALALNVPADMLNELMKEGRRQS